MTDRATKPKVSALDTLAVDIVDSDYTVRVDEASSTVTYVGKAESGTSTASALWQVIKIEVSGAVTSVLFAGGSSAFNQIWDDRTSLSYS